MTKVGDDRERWIGEAVGILTVEGRGSLFRIPETDRSMIPTLDPGNLVMIDFRPHRLRRGDLLLFRQLDYLVVHRLLGMARFPNGRPCLRTRGDAMPRLDPPLDANDVVGRAIAAETRYGWRSLVQRRARLFATAMALHDLFWAGVGAGIAKGGPVVARGTPLVSAIDLATVRWIHGALFRLLHPRVARPFGERPAAGSP